jgi:integrase
MARLNRTVEKWLDFYPPHERPRRLRALKRFAHFTKRDPVVLLEKAVESTRGCQEIEEALVEYYRDLVRKGREESTATQWVRVVRSFFTRSGARLARFPRDIVSEPGYPPTCTLVQDDVVKMIQKRDTIRDQLVIAFLAQSGQRVGVVTAMKKAMIKEKGPKASPYGLVEVYNRDLVNPKGRNVNRYRVHYRFVIGREAMQLVKKMPDHEGGWLFDIGERQMGRIVNEAADDAGIQKRIQTRLGNRFMNTVHPNAFRTYWECQMRQGGVRDSDMLDFLMGNKLPYNGASDRFSEEEVLNAYRTAERKLKLDFRIASMNRRTLLRQES